MEFIWSNASAAQGAGARMDDEVVVHVHDLRLGARAWATSWVFCMVGSPVPMSRNWRIPASTVRCSTARTRK
jgi:hypothetical protein